MITFTEEMINSSLSFQGPMGKPFKIKKNEALWSCENEDKNSQE